MRFLPLAAIAAVLSSLAGAPLSGWAQAQSNLPQNQRELTLSPPTLDFGNVSVGSTASLTVTLSASHGEVTLSSDRANSSEFSIMGLTLPAKIRPGKSVQATIQFAPNAPGKASAKAGFFSNARDSPTLEGLSGTGVAQGPHDAYLTWSPGSPDAVGYNVYRSSVHGGPYQRINNVLDSSTNYTDYNVVGGQIYYYVATEVNGQGQESGYSKEVKARIPRK